MSDILIEKPLYLSIDIIDSEDRLPSLKLSCNVKNVNSKIIFDISFNFWVSCKQWDLFSNKQISELLDLDGVKRFEFMNDNKVFQLVISPMFSNIDIDFSTVIFVKLEENQYLSLINQFDNYPKWW